ncbi:unnamed protein product [Amoebophrya sp. A120]|nr:unnamed protein product [Amoebophrya sp. A120]|eukprot:GSA120T00003578001.1
MQRIGSKEATTILAQEGLQCPICLDFLCEPLTLQCNHSFCRLCLLQSTTLAPDGRSCPQCRKTIEDIQDPATHAVDTRLKNKVLLLKVPVDTGDEQVDVVPVDVYEARKKEHLEQLQEWRDREAQKLPVFVYGGTEDYNPGSQVQLHFFEPRYRVLIRRAWEGNRRFLCCKKEPLTAGDRAVVVEIGMAQFLPDGRANIVGKALERVQLQTCWVEQNSEGLWYAKVAVSTPEEAGPRGTTVIRMANPGGGADGEAGGATTIIHRSANPQGGGGGGFFNTSSGGSPGDSNSASARNLSAVQFLLQEAIHRGAPLYNRGDIPACFQLYFTVGRTIVSMYARDAPSPDQQTTEIRMLTNVVRKFSDQPPRSGRAFDAAAWELRHCFDAILAMSAGDGRNRNSSSGGSIISLSPVGAAGGRGSAGQGRGSSTFAGNSTNAQYIRELPVLHIPREYVTLPRPGNTATLRLVEPRYCTHLIRVVAVEGEFLSTQEYPRPGGRATLVKLDNVGVPSAAGDVRVTIRGLRYVRFQGVRTDAAQDGLSYGTFDPTGRRRWLFSCLFPCFGRSSNAVSVSTSSGAITNHGAT